MREDIRDLYNWKGVEIIAGKAIPDHTHLLLSIPPKYRVSSFMGYRKGERAMVIFGRHANLKYQFGNRNFRAVGQYVGTMGIQEKAEYIQE